MRSCHILGATLQVLLSSALAACTSPTPIERSVAGTGNYMFDAAGTSPSTPVPVYFHVPPDAHALSPVVLVLHGAARDADEYLAAWTDSADQLGFVIAAPVFSEQDFPGINGYALGNVFLDGEAPHPDELNAPELWSYSLIEPLIQDFKARAGNQSAIHHVFGHSAGAQFAHRLVQFVPQGSYGFVIAANAGWYTVPDSTVRFPYGLQAAPPAHSDHQFFRHHLQIHAGADDTNPSSAALRHTAEADAQGAHRLARAQYFVDESRALATETGNPLQWELVTVQGVGHDHVRMAEHAAQWLADALGSGTP